MKILPSIHALAGFIAIALVLFFTVPVYAQEGYTLQLTLSVLQASPGATIEITGTHFQPDDLVTFVLHREGKQTQLGTFYADDHGDFETSVLLPYDLPFGEYEFRGVDERGDFAIAPLIIVPDSSGEEDGDLREEDDGLLAPMPTYPPDYAPTPITRVEAPTASSNPWSPVVVSLAVLGVLVLIFVLVRRRTLR